MPRTAEDPAVRFRRKYIVIESGCWLWVGTFRRGYPSFALASPYRLVGGHRYSYVLHKGEIPCGAMICHTCDNKMCVNPEHLYAGTAQDNADDRVRRGRATGAKLGEQHHNAKLSDLEVASIRADSRRNKELALVFGVSQGTISRIRSGKRRLL